MNFNSASDRSVNATGIKLPFWFRIFKDLEKQSVSDVMNYAIQMWDRKEQDARIWNY
jgi:hypothetical protein